MASGRRWGRVFVLARRGVSSKEEEMASRLLGVYALHQDLTRLSGDYYREIRAVRARLAAAAAPLHARRRAVLLGEEAPPAAQLEDEDMRESTRKAIDAALAGFDENQTGLSGLFWKEVLSSIEPAEEDVISEADKKMFGHLVDVRCAARIEGSAEVVSVEMEFGPGAPVEPKTLRAVFEKDAASGTFLKTTEVTVPEWSSNDANPTLKKIKGKAPPTPKGGKGKKKKKQQQQQPAPAPTKVKYVKATSFFHIFNHIENFEIFPDRDDIDDDVEAEDEDFEEESWYNVWGQAETTADLVTKLQDEVVPNAIDIFLSKHHAWDGYFEDHDDDDPEGRYLDDDDDNIVDTTADLPAGSSSKKTKRT